MEHPLVLLKYYSFHAPVKDATPDPAAALSAVHGFDPRPREGGEPLKRIAREQ
jgi:hypothetical protein